MAEERRDGADWRSREDGSECTGAEMGVRAETTAEMRGASTERARGTCGPAAAAPTSAAMAKQ